MEDLSGIYLPVITPFYGQEVDYESYVTLLNFYKQKDISGFIPLGTTGEIPCINDDEYERIIDITLETLDGQFPVYAGLGGNYTEKLIKRIGKFENTGIKGILSVCPYYNRPDQNGLFNHFERISESTDLDIIIYNIPYRTGVNMSNETLLALSEFKNIRGVKDSCGDMKQSLELIAQKPEGFSVLTGEDYLFYITVANGGDGGILASAHLHTDEFINVYKHLKKNNHKSALEIWRRIERIIPKLFEEPNPAPLKYCLSRLKRIRSPETRAPLGRISEALQMELDTYLSL
ncbi:MAG: 4-hydroxy-tetrahydrodipicolinate synthase [Desulfobacteraceae bacterium]|nr:4-hydroxy-tetrahydrodipicolinate synthase [Desulfobacteraceae bacterium]